MSFPFEFLAAYNCSSGTWEALGGPSARRRALPPTRPSSGEEKVTGARMVPSPESPAGEPPTWWNDPEAFAGAKAAERVHGEQLGLCWASCFPDFRTRLCISATGERAAAFKSLRPVREAGEGGQDFQEALLQGGSEKSLDPPHAALPGPLPGRSPGKTRPPPSSVQSVGAAGPKRRTCEAVSAPPLSAGPVPHARLGRGPFRRPANRSVGAHGVAFFFGGCLQASSAPSPFSSSGFYSLPSLLGVMTQ